MRRYFARYCKPEHVDSPLLDCHIVTLEQAVALAQLGVQVTLYEMNHVYRDSPLAYIDAGSGDITIVKE